jgi:hypothetical protein
MAEKVSAAYNALPPDERAEAVFFGRNYGDAAAIDVYGPALRGPSAISGHNNYYLWGPRSFDGSVTIVVGGDPDLPGAWAASIHPAAGSAGARR